jgi:hypothetical protein
MAIAATMMPADQEFWDRHGEPSVSFEDDATYYALEPYLNDEAGELQVNQYDGATLMGSGVLKFIDNLKQAIVALETKPDEWVVRTDRWEQAGKSYSIEYKASKERIRSVAVALKDLAEQAYALGYKVEFIGD